MGKQIILETNEYGFVSIDEDDLVKVFSKIVDGTGRWPKEHIQVLRDKSYMNLADFLAASAKAKTKEELKHSIV